MLDKIKQAKSVIALQRQIDAMPASDQLALKILSLVVAGFMLFFLIGQPSYQYMVSAEKNLEHRSKLLAFVKENRQNLTLLAKSSSSSSNGGLTSQELTTEVSKQAKKFGLRLKRFEPSGENKLKVWVEKSSFDKIITWLNALRDQLGVSVEQISLEKSGSEGLVTVRLTLSS